MYSLYFTLPKSGNGKSCEFRKFALAPSAARCNGSAVSALPTIPVVCGNTKLKEKLCGRCLPNVPTYATSSTCWKGKRLATERLVVTTLGSLFELGFGSCV